MQPKCNLFASPSIPVMIFSDCLRAQKGKAAEKISTRERGRDDSVGSLPSVVMSACSRKHSKFLYILRS